MKTGSGHVFSEIYLHINWHCHKNEPLLPPELELETHRLIQELCRKAKGVHFKGIGGTATHIHLVIQVEPFVPLSEFVGRLKGLSSHEINKTSGKKVLTWQRGYGVVSFSRKHLPSVLQYVASQKEHHEKKTTNRVLEEVGD